MAGSDSPVPYIKGEGDEHHTNVNPQNFVNFNNQQQFNMPQQHFNQFGASHDSINPSELTMQNGGISMPSGSYSQSFSGGNNFGATAGSSYNMAGGAQFGDDELEDSFFDGANQDQFNAQQIGGQEYGQEFFGADQPGFSVGQNMNQYSQTPEGVPVQNQFGHPDFNQEQFRQAQFRNGVQSPSHSSFHSPRVGPTDVHNGSFGHSAKPNPRLDLNRKGSHSKSPMTPKTPSLGVGGLTLGTPDSGSLSSQAIPNHHLSNHTHHKSLSGQWDSQPGSMHSYGVDSPLSSPGQSMPPPQISEILKSGKHASLPSKVDTVHHQHNGSLPPYQTQEAKRRRRRESHNMVERRRRDNINERIQELSHLVPSHRLEDEKMKKHLANNTLNSPMSPTGITPPQATSLLAGGSGRRATGGITTGLPPDEKDKGPNKGDILNGAVSWARDLMWFSHVLLQRESEVAEFLASKGESYPIHQTDEEKRMRTELLDSIERNGPTNFNYSRPDGSRLRVPKHTDLYGFALDKNGNQIEHSSTSPDEAGTNGNGNQQGGNQYWGNNGHDDLSFKEEDEYDIEMN
jgi:Helix-loop-helix DNA-binding domain